MYLATLIFLPLIAIVNLILTPRFNSKSLNKIGVFWSILILFLFILIVILHNENLEFQYNNIWDWFYLKNTGVNWGSLIFSIDGVSIFFIGLSILLMPICIIMSINSITFFKKEFLISLFFMLLILIGVFTILDVLGFYILFEATLIPMFVIIGVWGSREEKVKAAFYFFFYTLVGSLLMLLGIFKLYSITGTTNYQTLLLIELPSNLQYWLFLGFFSSLAVKIPMVPVHIWLPQAHVEAPVAGSVLLAGILLKLGGYGFIRFAYPLFPLASEYFTPFVLLLSVIALIFASLTTCRQTDVKRLIAYSSVAHMGLVTVAIFTHSTEGIIASLCMMIAHGLVSSGLFMSSAVIYVRHHSRAIKYFRGLAITMPIFSSITLVLILANIGFPLTYNFIAEFLSILAAFDYSLLLGALCCIGALLSTVYALYFYNRIFFGNVSSHLENSREMVISEFNGFFPLVLLTIALGVFPNLLIRFFLSSTYINISL